MEIDQDTIAKAVSCGFSQICLTNFDTSLCCEIIDRKDNFLLVRPASTFKSMNCTYRNVIKDQDTEVQVCSCPIRIAIYDKYGK